MSELGRETEPLEPKEDDETEIVRACRGCLATETNLYDLHEKGFAQIFGEFTGIAVIPTDGFPQLVCTMCLCLLRKFFKFRVRCDTAMWMLQQMKLNQEPIRTDSIKSLETSYIKCNLIRSEVQQIDIIDIQDKDENCEIEELNVKIDDILDENSDNKTVTTDNKTVTNEVKKKYSKRKKNDCKNDDQIDDKNVVEKIDSKVDVTPIPDNKNVKEENDDENDCVILNYNHAVYDINDDTDSDDETLKEIKENQTKKKALKRKRIVTKEKEVKRVRVRKKKERNIFYSKKDRGEVSDGEEEDIGDDWRRIIKEIEEEHANNQLNKRNMPSKVDIQFLIKKAKMFSKLYNFDVKFMSKEEMKLEVEEKRNSDKFKKTRNKCEICCKVFTHKETYERHFINHDPSNGEIECEICFQRFKTQNSHQRHFNKMHFRKIKCRDCGTIFRAWCEAKSHYLWHQGEHLNITCDICGMLFTRNKDYLNHLQSSHPGSGKVQCALCERTFINAQGLMTHMRKAHKKNARCSTCGGVFASADALAVHMNSPDDCRQGISSCPECGQNFTDESLMKQHFSIQHKKSFKCELCHKEFFDERKFSRHNYKHRTRGNIIGVRGPPRKGAVTLLDTQSNIVCEICGKKEKCLATLRVHQRLHTGEKPFKCELCQKAFRSKWNLKTHMTTHTNERNYQCPMCPKAFKQFSHRVAHLLTHTKEQPFACSACPKRYKGSGALKDHMDTAHRGLPSRFRKKDHTNNMTFI